MSFTFQNQIFYWHQRLRCRPMSPRRMLVAPIYLFHFQELTLTLHWYLFRYLYSNRKRTPWLNLINMRLGSFFRDFRQSLTSTIKNRENDQAKLLIRLQIREPHLHLCCLMKKHQLVTSLYRMICETINTRLILLIISYRRLASCGGNGYGLSL